MSACRPGVTGVELRSAAVSTGVPLGDEPIVVGIGMGVEPPVVATGIGDRAVLEAGMVLAVSTWVADERRGGWYERRIIEVADVPRVLGPVPLSGWKRGDDDE